MSQKRIGRKINDGSITGIKQDKVRNSRFEYEGNPGESLRGSRYKTANTLSGPYEENRGRRAADERFNDEDNPFENGELSNWNRKQGWDRFYDAGYDREGSRSHGGALMDHDGRHRGKGPRGYTRSDKSIFEDVCETLALDPLVDASNIEVSVKNGCVYLEGDVNDRETKRAAENSIENVSGVHDVQNYLRIKRESDTQTSVRGENSSNKEERGEVHH